MSFAEAFFARGFAAVDLALALETVAMISSLRQTDFKPLSSRQDLKGFVQLWHGLERQMW